PRKNQDRRLTGRPVRAKKQTENFDDLKNISALEICTCVFRRTFFLALCGRFGYYRNYGKEGNSLVVRFSGGSDE
ncbi:MAG: hypothetical protein ACYSWW_15325, partial [Planctomycetota bacterium]